MEVILLERVEKLGGIGDVVKVKNGFARNYLLPNKKALRANEANRKLFETNRGRIEEENADKRAQAEQAAKGVEGKAVQLIRQASNVGHLYGSVSARDIVEALEAEGAKVTKSQVILDRPIKAIGVHEIKIALHPEVAVTVKVNVARSPEEADLQAQGVDVMAEMFERDTAPLTDDLEPAAAPADGEASEAADTVDAGNAETADAGDVETGEGDAKTADAGDAGDTAAEAPEPADAAPDAATAEGDDRQA